MKRGLSWMALVVVAVVILIVSTVAFADSSPVSTLTPTYRVFAPAVGRNYDPSAPTKTPVSRPTPTASVVTQ